MARSISKSPDLGTRKTRITSVLNPLKQWRAFRRVWPTWRKRRKILVFVVAAVFIWTSLMYSVAQYYIYRHRNEPISFGATFVANYAREFGLDPKLTFDAVSTELGLDHLRLVSYWDIHESEKGAYDFSELDWQFKKATATNTKISLSIGLRQPRWPECHMPSWAKVMPINEWYPHLKNYMSAVIQRYGSHPMLQSYQLENEFFMTAFGECPDHSRERLIDEYELVKKLDTDTPIIVSRSNNWIGLPLGDPRPDIFGISVYKRVWDKTITKRYFEYPLPAWFYASLAGGGELLTGRNMILHELQAEPWPPEKYRNVAETPIEEQNKSMDAKRLKDRINYGVATGMKTIDFWGVEWWYWRMVKADDPSVWETAKTEIAKYH